MVDVKTDKKNILFVDGKEVEFSDERNLLEVIRKAGIDVPTFCYRPDLSIYGACRMCVVEVEGRGVQSSCTMPPEAGIKVKVNTEKTRRVRKMSLELLLANHNRECTMCEKSGECELQDLSTKMGIKEVRFGKREEKSAIDDSNPSVVRDPNKCILCGDCVRACSEIQGQSVLEFAGRGSKTVVTPAFCKDMKDVDCVYCGQCIQVCPTAALTIKSETEQTWKALLDAKKTVVAQIAPAVRVALGEAFGLPKGTNSIGLIVAALRKMGFDKVFDTTFSADLTIMEEGTELLSRVKTGEKLPIFTSCCPAWVRFAELKYPQLLNNLSTCRSPQQMFGSVMKKFLPQEMGIESKDVVTVSIMPCTAKKAEAKRPEFAEGGEADIDIVLTTQELARMIKEAGIDIKNLEPEETDAPFGMLSGAGVIFANTGGVLEAALRTAYEVATGKPMGNIVVEEARGFNKFKEFSVDLEGKKLKIAICATLNEADDLCKKIISGEAHYDMVEVMACPAGCITGGGQPQSCKDPSIKEDRMKGIYQSDVEHKIRKSHENTDVQKLYKEWLKNPNSELAHEFLHTHYHSKKRIEGGISFTKEDDTDKLQLEVCVGTCCYNNGSYDTMQKFIEIVADKNVSDKVAVKGRFCFEKCGVGPNMSVNGQLIYNATSDRAKEIFESEIEPKL
ncbi:MAG: NADH-dependent [FeFe] hydrogenase, group A6 [bacterium]